MNKRQKEVIQAQLTEEQKVIRQLEKHYRLALDDVEMVIRLLQSDDQTPSKIRRIAYQQKLKTQLEAILERMRLGEYKTLQEYLTGCYTSGYVGTMYDIHGQGVPVIAPINQDAAAKAIQLDTQLSTRKVHKSANGEMMALYESLGIDTDGLKKTIRSEITRGIANGSTYDIIARNIANVSKAPLARAKTIARTEGHRIMQQSAEDARLEAQKHGADVVRQWDATLDGDTRSAHRELDGQIVELGEYFHYGTKKAKYPGGFGDPALDCNCRCVALTRARRSLDYKALETLKKRAEAFGLDKTESFKEFEKKYLKAAQTVDLPKFEWGTIPEDEAASYEETLDMLTSMYPMRNKPIDWVGDFRVINGYDIEVDYYDFIDENPNWDGVGAMFVPSSTVHGKPYIQIVRQDIAVGSAESYLKDLAKIREKYGWRSKQDSFYQLVGNTGSMLTHEYGHALAYDCGLYGGRNEAREIWEIFESYTSEEIGKQLSIYATTNPNEMVAESFVQSFDPEHQSEISKKIMALLKKARSD